MNRNTGTIILNREQFIDENTPVTKNSLSCFFGLKLKELSKSHPKNLLIQDLLTDCYKALGMKKEYYIASGSKYALVSDYNRSNMYYNYAYQFATTKLDKAKINAMIVQNEQNRKSDAQFEN